MRFFFNNKINEKCDQITRKNLPVSQIVSFNLLPPIVKSLILKSTPVNDLRIPTAQYVTKTITRKLQCKNSLG